jgi:sec-independent protein translocase protein TatC
MRYIFIYFAASKVFQINIRVMGTKKDGEMSFLDHLEELRWHLIRSFLAILVGAILAFIYKNIIFDQIILAPRSPDFWTNRVLCEFGKKYDMVSLCINSIPLDLISVKMSGQFSMHVTVSLIVGLIMAFPYVFWEFWSFVAPALHSKEKRYARGAVFISSALFLLGVVFGFYLIVPFTVAFLGSYSVSPDVVNKINLISYVTTITSVVLASGIVFELPILAFFLTKIGLITPGFMRKFRKHSIVVIFIIAAIITPPDVISQTLVAVPLLLLYEVSILVSAAVVRRKKKEDEKNNI